MNILTKTKKSLLATGIAGITLFGLANAQQAGQPAQQPPAAPEPVEITDEVMDKTAGAYIEVIDIQQSVQEKMAGVNDQQEIQKHVQKAQQDMLAVIKKAGLEAKEYEEVMTQVTTDEKLRAKFVALLQEKRAEKEDG